MDTYRVNYPYYNSIIDSMKLFLDGINGIGFDFVYDLNEVTKYSKDDIFTNFWIHCNELGNKMVAREVIEFLKNKGELC